MKFYATIDSSNNCSALPQGFSYMLPVSSWAGKRLSDLKRKGKQAEMVDYIPLPQELPPGLDIAADCGGFVATKIWGDYRYTPDQYVGWLYQFGPSWAATMDYCCEEKITGANDGVVRERQEKTTANAYYFWERYRLAPWSWCPTVQGWEVTDYRHHARELAPLIREMYNHYGIDSSFRVGVGTLCNRADTKMIHAVVNAVCEELPGVPLHLWGVKLDALKDKLYLPSQIVSVDSGAWNGDFRDGIDRNREGRESLGLTRHEYRLQVTLPDYVEKFNRAVAQPKQTAMFSQEVA